MTVSRRGLVAAFAAGSTVVAVSPTVFCLQLVFTVVLSKPSSESGVVCLLQNRDREADY